MLLGELGLLGAHLGQHLLAAVSGCLGAALAGGRGRSVLRADAARGRGRGGGQVGGGGGGSLAGQAVLTAQANVEDGGPA